MDKKTKRQMENGQKNYEILDAGQLSHQIYIYEILDSSKISHQIYNQTF